MQGQHRVDGAITVLHPYIFSRVAFHVLNLLGFNCVLHICLSFNKYIFNS